MEDLHKVAKGLLEYETLNADEVQTLLHDRQIDRSDQTGPTDGGRRASVPKSGKAAAKPDQEPPGGLEPEPQPGG
jgi:cell division protease FtsH